MHNCDQIGKPNNNTPTRLAVKRLDSYSPVVHTAMILILLGPP